MKILFCSDMHLGLVVGGYDMRLDTIRVLKEIAVASQSVDLVVVGGDLFHVARPMPQAYADAVEFLNDLEAPVIVIRGNHDESDGKKVDALGPLRKIEWGDSEYYLRWFDVTQDEQDVLGGETGLFVADLPGIVEFKGKKFLLAGSIANARAVGYGAESAQSMVIQAFELALSEGVDAAFCHLDVHGAEAGSEGSFLRGGVLQIPMDLARRIAAPVADGHIHREQIIGNVFIPGSVVPTDFSDVDGRKCYAVLEV